MIICRKSLVEGKSMKIDSIDHVVFTVNDIHATCEFYSKVLGMEVVTFGEGRKALAFGSQKINLQQLGRESTLIADKPTSGSADICFVTSVPVSEVIAHLNSCGVRLVGGPVERNGARGMMMSVYFRDPDLNLVEVSNYASS
jgi:catechol 2,3-dioxygenase-like lactoylglutathione lyase family enzyme